MFAAIAACAAAMVAAVPASAAPRLDRSGVLSASAAPRLDWSGVGHVRLGQPLAAAARALGRPVMLACGRSTVSARGLVAGDIGGRRAKVNELHSDVRGARGPRGVRVGMSDRALRRALGRGTLAFSAHGKHGRLLAGPKGHSVWVLEAARGHRVVEIGIAASKSAALLAAKARACTPAPSRPAAPPPPAPTPQPQPQPPPQPDPVVTQPAPSTTTPPPQCPATLPTVGPYMHVACDSSTGNAVQYTCQPDWRDLDSDPSDGCESEKDGTQTMWFQVWSSMALQDHILGSFRMDGYGGLDYPMTTDDWGFYQSSDPANKTAVVTPSCDTNPSYGCPGGQPENPAPTLRLDMSRQGNDAARAVISPTGAGQPTGSPYSGTSTGYTQANGTARFRVTTPSPIPFTYQGASCQVAIDTTNGNTPDLTLTATLSRTTANGPPQVSGVSIVNFESADYKITGDIFCATGSTSSSTILGMIEPALEHWYDQATDLCATSGPYWWEPC